MPHFCNKKDTSINVKIWQMSISKFQRSQETWSLPRSRSTGRYKVTLLLQNCFYYERANHSQTRKYMHTHTHTHYPCCETECFLFWLMDLLTTSFSLYQLPLSIKDPCSTRFPSMAPFPVGTISQQTLWPMLPLCQAVYTSSGNRTCVCQCVT